MDEHDEDLIRLPEALGRTWPKFVELWCGGHVPGYELSMAINALRTVGELWPESIPDRKGLYAACGLIELGRSLNLVRGCPGFGELLHRLKLQDQGAHAELIVASSLIRSGLPIRLGAACESSVLDIAIEDASGPVFVEITSPHESKDLAEQRKLTLEFSLQLSEFARDFSVEVEFLDDPTPELVETLLARMPSEASGVWREVGSSARFRRWPSQADSKVLSVAWPGIDHRAEKIVRRKCEQLAKDVPNVIVIDMSSIGGSTSEWLEAARRLFQPTKNRRIGAIALFESLFSAHLDRGYRLWWIIENPHASCRIPAAIVLAFAALDERSSASAQKGR